MDDKKEKNEISLSLGDVSVSLSDPDENLEERALHLVDILLAKCRREVKYSISGDPADLKDEIELKEKDGSEKTKSNDKSKQIQASYA